MSEPMRHGDWFRWSYRVPPSRHEPYWCKALVARFDGKRLVDDFWGGTGDSSSWTEEQAREQLDLVFVANEEDLEPVCAGRMSYAEALESYREEDLVDLSHPNGGRVYKRKGAKLCLGAERAAFERKRAEAQSRADYYADRIRQIDAGEWPGPTATLWHDCAGHGGAK